MAAGCVPVCYEAVGGRDFLRDGENAIVFPNHDVYALVERVCELMDHAEISEPLLDRLRAGGARTAATFSPRSNRRGAGRVLRRAPVQPAP